MQNILFQGEKSCRVGVLQIDRCHITAHPLFHKDGCVGFPAGLYLQVRAQPHSLIPTRVRLAWPDTCPLYVRNTSGLVLQNVIVCGRERCCLALGGPIAAVKLSTSGLVCEVWPVVDYRAIIDPIVSVYKAFGGGNPFAAQKARLRPQGHRRLQLQQCPRNSLMAKKSPIKIQPKDPTRSPLSRDNGTPCSPLLQAQVPAKHAPEVVP